MNARTCIVNRTSEPRENLMRFVLGPENMVYPDLKARLPGRGVWVTGERNMIEEAMRKNLFARGFKAKCQIDPEMPEKIDQLLVKTCLDSLSMTKKAGEIITGFDKISMALSKRPVDVLIQASDGAGDGQGKLENKFCAVVRSPAIIRLFSSAQLNLALGGTNVIHAAITHGRLAPSVCQAVNRLAKYRGLKDECFLATPEMEETIRAT